MTEEELDTSRKISSSRQIFTIYVNATLASALGRKALRQYWRDQVTAQGGTPVPDYSIGIRPFGNRCAITGVAERVAKPEHPPTSESGVSAGPDGRR